MEQKPPNQFDVARKRVAQQEKAQLQGQEDAIRRRAAARGNLNSGATIKQESLARDAAAKRSASAHEGIDAAEHAENRRVREVQEGRDFARSEREASQSFAGEQAALQRALAERGLSLQETQFDFSKQQHGDQMGLARDQFAFAQNQWKDQEALQKAQFNFAKSQWGDQEALQKAQLVLAKDQFKQSIFESDRDWEQNVKNNSIASIVNLKKAGFSQPQIINLLKEIHVDPKTGVVTGMEEAARGAGALQAGDIGTGPGQVSTGNPGDDRLLQRVIGGEEISMQEHARFKKRYKMGPHDYVNTRGQR